ncbi:hypothetical protein KR074_000678, partial [Drosophila pseudoananassae]
FSKDFHNYTIIWRHDKIIFKVDGESFGKITDEKILKMFRTQCYLTLGLTVGGAENFNPDILLEEHLGAYRQDPSIFRGSMKFLQGWKQPSLVVDYIRVYALDERGY